jgi:hypothetical protein
MHNLQALFKFWNVYINIILESDSTLFFNLSVDYNLKILIFITEMNLLINRFGIKPKSISLGTEGCFNLFKSKVSLQRFWYK